MESEQNVLNKIHNSKDVKSLTTDEKINLAKEIREFIINIVAKNGGHLASNLGVVELTIALYNVFNFPEDKIVWDVGHQTYVHKILSGRKEKMETIRKLGGIAGFPKTSESEYDAFNTGHSSTSISVALGIAKARDLRNEKNDVIALIGDGALTGGMALEALNDAGNSKTNLIVILNDNEMSISKNVGGISLYLSRIRTRKFYKGSNNCIKSIVKKIPILGNIIIKTIRRIKYSIKQLFFSNMLFENLGFTYLGPVDGHDIEKLESILKIAKRLEGPVLVHVVTKKGKGYRIAEENPDRFHAISPFNIKDGKLLKEKGKDYSAVFGEKIVSLAKKNEKIVTITAAMKDGTGLTKFAKEIPNRFFDVAIAEQHALGIAAGMAKSGLIPVVSIYSSFYQRAYDQVIHDIAMQNLPVVMCVDRAGLVGNDGETHQGIMDLSFFNIVPNLDILAPKNFEELEKMLEFAVNNNRPTVIRYPRGGEGTYKFKKTDKITRGKSEILKEGKDITILSIGKMVSYAMEVAEKLKLNNIYAEVINIRFLKPLDEELIKKSISKTKRVATIEDNYKKGGLASSIENLIIKERIKYEDFLEFGYENEYIKHGSVAELEKIYGLNVEGIYKKLQKIFY